MLSIVIVEDESRSQEVIKNLLEEYCEEVRIDGIASSVDEGVKVISSVQPDIVFLDIEMHPGTGFDVLERLDHQDFHLIFTTAYEHYALKAIRASAIAYLLKPIDILELQNAVAKASERIEEKTQAQQIQYLLSNLKSKERNQKLALKISGGVKFVEESEISYCEAEGSYTCIHFTDGKKLLQSTNLKEFESLLDKDNFIRVHHSFLVNVNQIDSWVKSSSRVIMKDGMSIAVSAKRKDEFAKRMNLNK